jgi:acylglycerol lipase
MPVYEIFGESADIEIPKHQFITDDELAAMEASLKGCKHGWMKSSYQNAKLHYRYWLPSDSKKPKGLVIFLHGISSHSGKGQTLTENPKPITQTHLIEYYVEKKGFALYCLEQYGHGFSEGTRFWIPKSFKHNLQDAINFTRLAVDEHVDIPLFVMGESYGGNLALQVSHHFQTNQKAKTKVDSCILIAPAIEGDLPPFPVYQILRYILAPLFPKWIPFFMPNPLPPNKVWRDEEVIAHYTNPRYVEMGLDAPGLQFRLGTALQLVLALEEVQSNVIPNLQVPFCVLHGTQDEGVPIQGSEFLYKAAKSKDKAFHPIQDARHDLLADPATKDCMDLIDAWIEKRMLAK